MCARCTINNYMGQRFAVQRRFETWCTDSGTNEMMKDQLGDLLGHNCPLLNLTCRIQTFLRRSTSRRSVSSSHILRLDAELLRSRRKGRCAGRSRTSGRSVRNRSGACGHATQV